MTWFISINTHVTHLSHGPLSLSLKILVGGRDPLAHGTEQDAELDILIIPYTPTETRMESSCTCVSAAQKLRDGPWIHVLFGNNDATSTDKKGGDMQSLETCPIQLERKKKRENKRKRTRGQGRPVGRCLRRTFVMCLAQSRASPARLPKNSLLDINDHERAGLPKCCMIHVL